MSNQFHTLGDRVRTVRQPTEASDWMPEALANRRWGVVGTIVAQHDAHGLTYEVRHPDGTIGHYEPNELEPVQPPGTFLDDSFWDTSTSTSPAAVTVAPSGDPELEEYGRILQAFFPSSTPFWGSSRQNPDKLLAATCLGSHLIGVKRNKANQWVGIWSQTLGSFPLSRNQRNRSLSIQASRVTHSPGDFRLWLNLVANKILSMGRNFLADALYLDNFCPDFRFALQVANDLHLIGVTPDLLVDEIMRGGPTFTFTLREIHSYRAPVLAKGQVIGGLGLDFKNGRWRYGAQIQTPAPDSTLAFKHEAPPLLTLASLEQAKAAAERLYWSKTYEWLVNTGIVYPDLRTA